MQKMKLVAGILILVLPAFLGCGRGDLPDLGYVEGTVTLDGKPLPGALVTFQPKAGRPSYGRTDENGKYELVFTEGNKGATLGKHTVSISTLAEGDEDAGIEAVPEKVPAQYNTSTELTADVQAGKNRFDFPLSSEGEIKVEAEPGATE